MKIDVAFIGTDIKTGEHNKAYATIILNDQIVINNITIYRKDERSKIDISFPMYSRYNKQLYIKPVVEVTDNKLLQEIKQLICEAYELKDVHICNGKTEPLHIKYIDPFPINDEKNEADITLVFKEGIKIRGIYVRKNEENRYEITYNEHRNCRDFEIIDEQLHKSFIEKFQNFYLCVMKKGKLSDSNIFKKFININKLSSGQKASIDTINKYKNIVPKDLLEVWKTCGFGCYNNGYIQIINPEKYQKVLDKKLIDSPQNHVKYRIPFLMNGFGEIFYYRIIEDLNSNQTETDISAFSLLNDDIKVVEFDFEIFIKDIICNMENIKEFDYQLFKTIVQQTRPLTEDEFLDIRQIKTEEIYNLSPSEMNEKINLELETEGNKKGILNIEIVKR